MHRNGGSLMCWADLVPLQDSDSPQSCLQSILVCVRSRVGEEVREEDFDSCSLQTCGRSDNL